MMMTFPKPCEISAFGSEDDIRVTDGDPENLTATVVREIDDIERIMAR